MRGNTLLLLCLTCVKAILLLVEDLTRQKYKFRVLFCIKVEQIQIQIRALDGVIARYLLTV